MAETPLTYEQLQERIARRAWLDPAFAEELMADPKGTFEKFIGHPLPERLKVYAHYVTERELHFVLPRRETMDASGSPDDGAERGADGSATSGPPSLVWTPDGFTRVRS